MRNIVIIIIVKGNDTRRFITHNVELFPKPNLSQLQEITFHPIVDSCFARAQLRWSEQACQPRIAPEVERA